MSAGPPLGGALENGRVCWFDKLPDEIVPLVFKWLDPKTMMTVVHAVCLRWRLLCRDTQGVRLDFTFLPENANLRLPPMDVATEAAVVASLAALANRFKHVVECDLVGMQCCSGDAVGMRHQQLNRRDCQTLPKPDQRQLQRVGPVGPVGRRKRGCARRALPTADQRHVRWARPADRCRRGCAGQALPTADQRHVHWARPADGRKRCRAGRALPAAGQRQPFWVPTSDGRKHGCDGRALPAADLRQLQLVHPADGRKRGRAGRALPAVVWSPLDHQ
jgi:hypothetical protein